MGDNISSGLGEVWLILISMLRVEDDVWSDLQTREPDNKEGIQTTQHHHSAPLSPLTVATQLAGLEPQLPLQPPSPPVKMFTVRALH